MNNLAGGISSNTVAVTRRRTLSVVLMVILGIAGATAAGASDHAHHPATTATTRHGAMDDAHLSQLIRFIEARIEQPQRETVEKLVREADKDLTAFEQQAEVARAPRARILLADIVDRDALERARLDELHVTDERSRRVNQLLIDVAATLTPQQRARLRAEMVK